MQEQAVTTACTEEDDEPRLKYNRLGASVCEILETAAASSLCVSEKILALGTHTGSVHVLDVSGNEVKRFAAHKATVNDISFDDEAEYIASCSDDGSVSISGLYTEEAAVFKYHRPVKTIALDPRYASRKTREFVTGGLAGQLILNSRGWLGSKDATLHSGEGPIHIARWSGSLVAWANDLGVKVYDTSTHRRIAFVPFERPAARCHLFWEGESTLYMGWADLIKVAQVQLAQGADGGKSLEVRASLHLDCIISGIAPFGQDLAVLAYMMKPVQPSKEANGEASAEGHEPVHSERPELKIITWQSEELASDALSIQGFEHYEATDYALATCDPLGRHAPVLTRESSSTKDASSPTDGASSDGHPPAKRTREWLGSNGHEPLYYVVSPKDVVAGRLRDTADRIAWLLEHSRFAKALSVAEGDPTLKPVIRQQVVNRYLEHLLKIGEVEKAASLCPSLFKGDAAAWERWVFLFAQRRHLGALAMYIPTKDPRLRGTAYRMVLDAFLLQPSDHPRLLALLHAWPPDLYSLPSFTEAVVARIRGPGGDSTALLQSAAHLYQAQGRFDLALAILLRLRRPDAFDFIAANGLQALLRGPHIAQLLRIDEARTLQLLVDNAVDVPPAVTVPAIQVAGGEAERRGEAEGGKPWRRRLHQYLDRLFRSDPTAATEFHSLQVELYAEFAPSELMAFLVSSQSYALGEAFELCAAAGLVREQVFILGRMGNAREALQLIIDQLGDVPQAIDFVQMQGDDELWDLLITLALGSPDFTGKLMDHMGGYINPLSLVSRIPLGMDIPCLRDRLVSIIADFRTQTSLREGCNTILAHDCVSLAQRLYHELHTQPRAGRPAEAALPLVWVGMRNIRLEVVGESSLKGPRPSLLARSRQSAEELESEPLSSLLESH
ncbi:hypothetical protein WJX73_009236 [Symbiochloris irregularis]|uniref:Vps41 beta-propeller domain-containing protein n=1 Tax=Symbiochloris irregularis TaxID=706552 RepID=A0AAW1NVG8_9CHLO